MAPQFDHAVIFVSNLEEAIADFVDLGFDVVRGGSHGSTENALIIFANQTYLELLGVKAGWSSQLMKMMGILTIMEWLSVRRGTIFSRLIGWISGELGPVDWCVRVDDLITTTSEWSAQGLDVLETQEFSRKRPDGKIARWCLGGTKNGCLPILLEDITPMVDRMPLLAEGRHPNGATKLLQVGLRENDKTFASNVLKKFITPYSSSNSKNDDVINIGGVGVHFGEASMATKMSLTLSYSGEGSQDLDLDKTHGVAIKLVPGPQQIC